MSSSGCASDPGRSSDPARSSVVGRRSSVVSRQSSDPALHSSTLAGIPVGGAAAVRVVGVVNVGRGSFYQGSVVQRVDAIGDRARALVQAGAEIIDVGARSTAPYLADLTSEDEEAAALAEAVRAVRAAVSVPVSADTPRAGPLAAAIAAGATIANDVSGLADPGCAALIAEHGLGLILMPDLTRPFPERPIEVVVERLGIALERARAAGIPADRIVVDPGIGFFRPDQLPWYEWDNEVIARLPELAVLGRPVLIGVSRKSFVGAILGQSDPTDRLIGSLAATAIAVALGVSAVRTHDVAQTIEAIRVAERIRSHQPALGER